MNLCKCGCDQPLDVGARQGYAGACYRRWIRAGRPESGPPPPMSSKAISEAAIAAKLDARDPGPYVADPYDLEQARLRRQRQEAWPEMLGVRSIVRACRIVPVVRARDAHGVHVFLRRLNQEDLYGLVVALAETADPWQLLAEPDQGEEARSA